VGLGQWQRMESWQPHTAFMSFDVTPSGGIVHTPMMYRHMHRHIVAWGPVLAVAETIVSRCRRRPTDRQCKPALKHHAYFKSAGDKSHAPVKYRSIVSSRSVHGTATTVYATKAQSLETTSVAQDRQGSIMSCSQLVLQISCSQLVSKARQKRHRCGQHAVNSKTEARTSFALLDCQMAASLPPDGLHRLPPRWCPSVGASRCCRLCCSCDATHHRYLVLQTGI
jgi:hypothetical protein